MHWHKFDWHTPIHLFGSFFLVHLFAALMSGDVFQAVVFAFGLGVMYSNGAWRTVVAF